MNKLEKKRTKRGTIETSILLVRILESKTMVI